MIKDYLLSVSDIQFHTQGDLLEHCTEYPNVLIIFHNSLQIHLHFFRFLKWPFMNVSRDQQ